MSKLSEVGKNLEAGGASPFILEVLILGVPSIMVVGVPKEGASSLPKIVQLYWAFTFCGGEGVIARQVVLAEQVVPFHLPFIADAIHHDKAILMMPSRGQHSLIMGDVNLNLMGQGCIIRWLIAVR